VRRAARPTVALQPRRGTVGLRPPHDTHTASSRRSLSLTVHASSGTAAAEVGEKSHYGALDNAFAAIRAVGFYLTTIAIAVPLFHVMLWLAPVVLLTDKFKRSAMHVVNDLWANLTSLLWYPIDLQGAENLPPRDTPVVYVANHQSFLDIFSLFRQFRPFKFVSQTSVFMFPIVGWSMFLTGHIGLKRTDRRSQMACLNDCREMLREGGSVLFFPEGTRSTTGEMDSFKKGAFSVAAKERVPVVPITLVGTGQILTSGKEGFFRRGKVTMVVHPVVVSDSADELCKRSEAVIKETLHKYDYLVKQ